jgi:hypothetical protein
LEMSVIEVIMTTPEEEEFIIKRAYLKKNIEGMNTPPPDDIEKYNIQSVSKFANSEFKFVVGKDPVELKKYLEKKSLLLKKRMISTFILFNT